MSSHLAVAVAASSLAILLGLVQLYRLWKGPLSHLPGPTSTKFSGLRYKYSTVKGTRVHYVQELHKAYGPIVRISPTEVSVADLQATRDIYKSNSGYNKTEFYSKFATVAEPSVFTTTDPIYHGKIRKLLAYPLSESNLKGMQSQVWQKVELLQSQLANDHQKQGYVDVFKWAHCFATDVIGEMSFGESFRMLETGEDNQYMHDLMNLTRANTMRMIFMGRPMHELPEVYVWPLKPFFERRDRMLNYARQSINRYIKHVKENPDEEKTMLFSRLMGEKGQAAGLSDTFVSTQAQGYLVAGTDTTAVTLTFIIYMVATHPQVRERLLAEMANLPEVPSNEDLKQFDYLEWIIEESLRLYGAAPAPLPRAVPHGGRTLGGYFIPEGKTVSPVAYVLHRDENIFPNPEQWSPERWEHPTEDMKHAFLPFGGGARVCIGLHLARMELRMAVVSFFRRFPNATPAFGVNGFSESDMDVIDYFIVKPKGGRCLMK